MERNETYVEEIENKIPIGRVDPFPDQTPTSILTRWRQMETFTFSASTGAYHYPLASLMTVPAIEQALATFRYLRTNWEVKFIVTSMPQQYGVVYFSHQPWLNTTDSLYDPANVVFDHNCVILDISQQNEVIMKCEYISPFNFFLLRGSNRVSTYQQMSKIWIGTSGVKTTDSTVSSSINLQMWCRMVDPIAAGHVPLAAITETRRKAKAQSKTGMGALGVAGMTMLGALRNPGSLSASVMSELASHGASSASVTETEPSSDDMQEGKVVANRIWGTLLNSKQTQCSKLGFLNESHDSNYGDDQQEHSFGTLLRKWSFTFGEAVAASNVTPFFIDSAYPTSGNANERLAFYGQFFRLWRGSIDFLFYFVSSPFYTSRWIIALDYRLNGSPPTSSDIRNGDMPTYEVNVRGSTWSCISVPYMSPYPWLTCNDSARSTAQSNAGTPLIWLLQLDPPRATGDQTPTTFVYVWERAGKDFQFAHPCAAALLTAAPTIADAQTSVNQMGDDPIVMGAGMTIPLFQGKSDAASVEQLMRRYSFRPPTTGITNEPVAFNSDSVTTISKSGNFDLLASTFLYFSGSMKYKARLNYSLDLDPFSSIFMGQGQPYNATNPLYGIPFGQNVDDGMVAIDMRTNPVFDFETPFFHPLEVRPCGQFLWDQNYEDEQGFLPILCTPGGSSSFSQCFVAAGDTFRLYYDYPPWESNYWPQNISPPPPFVDSDNSEEARPLGLEESSSLSTSRVLEMNERMLRKQRSYLQKEI